MRWRDAEGRVLKSKEMNWFFVTWFISFFLYGFSILWIVFWLDGFVFNGWKLTGFLVLAYILNMVFGLMKNFVTPVEVIMAILMQFTMREAMKGIGLFLYPFEIRKILGISVLIRGVLSGKVIIEKPE